MGTAMFSSCFLFCVILNGVYSSIGFETPEYVEPEYLEDLLAKGQYEEFARLLRIDDVNLVKPAEGNRFNDPMFNKGLFEGDILLTPSQREQARQGIIEENLLNAKWNMVVPYYIQKKGYTKKDKSAILEAIKEWNEDFHGYITFKPFQKERDYVIFSDGRGCFSEVGRRGNQQTITLESRECMKKGAIKHEMAHAVGILHEHTRPDRDEYIKILNRNIPANMSSQYEKRNYRNAQILGPYDYYSVMHYPRVEPKTGQLVFTVQKDVRRQIGQQNDQTGIDKDKIKLLYSCRDA